MTATTYETQNAAVVAGTATVDAGESITEDIVLDSKVQLVLLMPDGDSGNPIAGDQTFISFQVQAFAGGDWSEAADEAGQSVDVQVFAGGIAPVPSIVAGAYAIRVRYGTASAPLDQDAERAIQFVASSPASNVIVTDPLDVTAAQGAPNAGGALSWPVTVQDGYNVTEGAINDAATAVGGVGTISAKLRLITSQLAALATGVAVSIANGSDVAEGSTTDAASTVGGTGSVSAKLRLMTTQLGSLVTGTVIAAGTALIGRVSASLETSTIYNGTTGLTPVFVAISASSNGNNTLVAADATKKIRVLAYTLVVTTAVTAKFQSAAGGTDLTGAMPFAANGGVSVPFNPVGHFETAANALLNLSLGSGVQVSGHLVYVLV